jgi:hypothetical protein
MYLCNILKKGLSFLHELEGISLAEEELHKYIEGCILAKIGNYSSEISLKEPLDIEVIIQIDEIIGLSKNI